MSALVRVYRYKRYEYFDIPLQTLWRYLYPIDKADLVVWAGGQLDPVAPQAAIIGPFISWKEKLIINFISLI